MSVLPYAIGSRCTAVSKRADQSGVRNVSYARAVISRASLAQVVAQFPQENSENVSGQK